MGDDRRSLPTLPPMGMAPVDQKHGAMFESDLRTTPPSTDIKPVLPDHQPQSMRLPSYPPPSYSQARQDPAAVGGTELPPIKPLTMQPDHDRDSTTLPSLSSLNVASPPNSAAQPPEPAHSPAPQVSHWPSLNPLTAYYNPSHAQNAESPMRMDVETISNSSVSGASSDRYLDGRASSVNLDDPDVRMAAEALGDLRADFVSSPGSRHTPQPGSPRSFSQRNQHEPILSLLTTYHPLLAHTIEGATSAYTSSKDFSPRIQWTAERLENVAGPIANAFGSVSRATGVDSGVRWILTAGKKHAARNQDVESADGGSNKRRKVGNTMVNGEEETMMDLSDGMQTPRPIFDPTRPRERRLSVASTIESLPAYDDATSPPYAEQASSQERTPSSVGSRFMMSSSALSIAMSPESLSRLKYCLGCLRWANEHIGQVVTSLRTSMESYEKTQHEDESGVQQSQASSSDQDQVNRSQMAAKIAVLKKDVVKTLQGAVQTVHQYTGSALPDNARQMVLWHLTNLPTRFKQAEEKQMSNQPAPRDEESQTTQDKATRESAQRVLMLAMEGLDVMTQVSGVLNGTIVSAEEWCDRLGRKKRAEREGTQGSPSAHPATGDEKAN